MSPDNTLLVVHGGQIIANPIPPLQPIRRIDRYGGRDYQYGTSINFGGRQVGGSANFPLSPCQANQEPFLSTIFSSIAISINSPS